MPIDPKLFDRDDVRERYLDHYDTLRGKVREEVVRSHLQRIVTKLTVSPMRVLDIGCGDGRDSLWLASLGHQVTGFDTSDRMLAVAGEQVEQADLRGSVELFEGDVDSALTRFGEESFDLVLSHGVIMYQDDPRPFVSRHLKLVRPNGMFSLLARNADGMAFRAAREASIDEAIKLLDDSGSLGHLGVTTQAHSIQELAAIGHSAGATVRSWAGVRVFTDTPSDPLLDADDEKILELERLAALRDPHRHTAALLHVLFLHGVDLSLLPA